ncbi:MAG: hypothetical protein RLZZ158_813 [Cyanobacteriota bacterium]|jgi:predicted Zn-dependent peptidase
MKERSLAVLRPALGFPAPLQTSLSNGCPITLLPLADASVVCLEFWCRAGSLEELPGESGLAHFLEHMVFKGSEGLGPGAFDLKIESLGGYSNAATGFDEVHYHLLLPPEGLDLACELLPRLVLQPSLEPAAFQMERQVVLEELAQSEDQPEEMAFQQLLSQACGNHGYGRPILGLKPDLLAHTPASMRAFQQRNYRSDRCALAVGGNFDPELLLAKLEAGPIARLGPADRDSHRGNFCFQAGHHQLALPRLESARLLMAWPCPPAGELDALMGHELWATLLAEGRRSRLVEELRENLQLVETIDLDIHPLEEGSLAILEATTEPEFLPRVIKAVQQVLQDVQEGINAQELERAKRLLGHGHSFGLEATSQVTHHWAQATLQGRLLDLDAPLQRLENWDLQRLQALAPGWDSAQASILEVLPA